MLVKAMNLLLKAQNADGGWGAQQGKQSNTEVTSFAILALSSTDQSAAVKNALDRGRHWLTQRQFADGSWSINDAVKESSWSTALAMLALNSFPEHRDPIVRAGQWSLKHEGSKPGILAKIVMFFTGTEDDVDLDADLIGWPWRQRSFSWVEPTSYFLLALKKSRQWLPTDDFRSRVTMADAMLYDRMCIGGGWNYGNKIVFGERLSPFPELTALALLALHDHGDDPRNQQSLQVLGKLLEDTPSGLSLSLAILCHSLYGHSTDRWEKLLIERFEDSQFLGEIKPLALAILAMNKGARLLRA